ncbi:hypothetical protein [Granulicella arctica]|uniref:hypothetical protein n=1 Tax=Granulicella arctica TaxID=940613 RepID=UPI0021DFD891|nr:hypothetical protein [Granulicella arctica]
MILIRSVCAVAVFFLLGDSAFGQDAPAASYQASFKFDRSLPGVLVPRYTIELHGDGTGFYRAEVVAPQSPEPQAVERPLTFSPKGVKLVFDALETMRASDTPCASKLKNIADTGTKILTYRDAKGDGSCTFNHSENKAAVQLTAFFQGVENTLEEGRALDFKHRFDRLGLDTEISNLAAAVDNGRAQELENIGSTLRSIAGDTALIERVRLRAAKLLEQAKAGE